MIFLVCTSQYTRTTARDNLRVSLKSCFTWLTLLPSSDILVPYHFKGVKQLKIAVFGTGYVGLVAGVCFADAGNQVIGVDIDADKIRKLQDGIVPIYEPGLDELLKSALKHKRIEFTTDKKKAVLESEIIFVAVGTPEGEDGSADLSHVLTVTQFIAETMTTEKIVVLKSTVPVGTATKVTELMARSTKLPFEVVNNPEFLKEGASIDDFLKTRSGGHRMRNRKNPRGDDGALRPFC